MNLAVRLSPGSSERPASLIVLGVLFWTGHAMGLLRLHVMLDSAA